MHGQTLSRWDDLRLLLAVLREGSFSAAARKLTVEQSTVSRRIAALEQELGSLLFDRLPDGPRATELATRLRAHAELVEAQVLAFSDEARGVSQAVEGRVRLALTESFAVQVVIPRVLATLRTRHPALAVDLLASDLSADLARREADIALRFYRPRGGDLVCKRVARLPLAVLGHKRYVRGRRREPSAFAWVGQELPGVTSPESEVLAPLELPRAMVVSSHLLQVEAVRAGLGVALLTRALRRLYPELVEVDLGLTEAPAVELWLVAPRALRAVPRVAAVWSMLEEALAELEG